MMYVLVNNRNKRKNKNVRMSSSKQLNINISFNQNIFKQKLTHVFTSEFIMSISMVKEAEITQSKRYPRSNTDDEHLIDVYRDCLRVYGSPLFCMHYEYPTNP